MSYSVKKFIRENCTDIYDISAIDDFATLLSMDSDGRYTSTSGKNILCRYVEVRGDKIVFDIDSRNPEQTYDSINKMIVGNSTQNNVITVKKEEPVKQKKGFGSSFSLNKITKDKALETKSITPSLLPNNINNDNVKTVNTAPKKGFGSSFSLKKFNIAVSSEEDNRNKSNTEVFTKSDIDTFSLKQNTIIKTRKQDSNNKYDLPVEKTYSGLFRDDPKYGPYGTDNYHDEIIKPDTLDKTEIRRVETYRKLASRYYPEQRSEEWFAQRDKLISASDGGTVVGLNPYEQNFCFITKKVFGKPFDTNEDCYHGKKFEQVATMIYEYRMNVKVKEFGLCSHPKYDFLGASPDGIVSEYKLQTKDGRTWEEIEEEVKLIDLQEDKIKYMDIYGIKTKYVGRMLEIKCPMRRKILMDASAPEVYGPHGEKITDLKKDCKKGVCPAYYWVQVQLQLQCCELDECDFWQCELEEYKDRDEFMGDTDTSYPWLSKQTNHEKGALIQLMPIEHINNHTLEPNKRIWNFAQFVYPPRISMTPLEIDQWISNTIHNLKITHKGSCFERVIYWKLTNSRNYTIARDDKWFKDNLKTFNDAWNYVKFFRDNKDTSTLLKKYISTFPTDYYGKIKEYPQGIIMDTINKLYSAPTKASSDTIEKKISDSKIVIPKEYDVQDDISYIKQTIETKIPDILEDNEKKAYQDKFKDFIKRMKADVDNFLFETS
jgi:putative phage-type endonuclease